VKRMIVGLATTVLVSGGLTLTGMGEGTAEAQPRGPWRWCPGQGTPYGGAIWDNSVCHTFWIVAPGLGNVDGPSVHNVWDGDNPPGDPPPPNLPPGLCRSEFPPQTCDGWGL
jgi:hypothetical protein